MDLGLNFKRSVEFSTAGKRMGLTRRDFLVGMGAIFTSQILLPSVMRGATIDSQLKPLRLGFMTDCHATSERNAPAWLEQTAPLMNSLRPDLVIGGGDFVDGGFHYPGSIMEEHWKLSGSFLKKIEARVEPVIGNHDFYEPLRADGSPCGKDPRWRFKKQFSLERSYRSFEYGGYRFIILDSVNVVGGFTPYRGLIDDAQLLWLDQELKGIPPDQPIILCTHIPFKTSLNIGFGTLLASSQGRFHVLNSDLVMEKLKDRPVILILQGHVHINERIELGGIPCITGGAVCGNWWHGPNMGTYPGLGVIEILPDTGSNGRTRSTEWIYSNTPTPPQT